jgi:CBS domain-containing protein
MSSELKKRLQQIAADLSQGEPTPEPTIREFLSWIGAKRRGYWIVQELRSELGEQGLLTNPDFESAFIDSAIRFETIAEEREPAVAVAAQPPCEEEKTTAETYADPTYRISKLQAANQTPVSVRPDDPLETAVTLMLTNDFSQLPVMTSDREVKGVISWRSLGSRLALGKGMGPVREFMDPSIEVDSKASLFDVIGQLVQHDYVLVRAADRRVSGIVTSSDLSLQFRQLTEPFLLLGEIENHVRRMIDDRFNRDELRAACDPNGPEREIQSVADLTFGEYVRLLQNPDQWEKLGVTIDRSVVVKQLDIVRHIRNDVMHFDPDGIPEEDLGALRDLARFLQTLQAIGVT